MGKDLSAGSATKLVELENAASIRVPAHWVVGVEDEGGIAIYDDRPGSGTLRPWTEEYAFNSTAERDATADDVHDGQPSEPLGERATLSYTVLDGQEDGEMLRFHRWIVAIRKGENRLRVVTFTHTVEPTIEDSDDTAFELQLISLAVRGGFYPGRCRLDRRSRCRTMAGVHPLLA
jgi:hypothetical protein